MARISLTRTLSGTIPFARRAADRAVGTARPIMTGLAGRVAAHLPGRSTTPSPSQPETFTPSKAQEAVTEESHPVETGPSPATIARNVAAPRPTATPPAARKPRSVPGAKLPVTRPST